MKRLKRLFAEWIAGRRVKQNFRCDPDDIFLVSYPKSGNTWIRFVLANLFYENDNVNFTNIHKLLPEINRISDHAGFEGVPRIIKSHDIYNPDYPRVIYIVRDGRDVYVSYYRYLQENLPPGMTFKAFLLQADMPFGRWSGHIVSWCTPQPRIHMVRYEDMHAKPVETIVKLLEFINFKANKSQIETALKKASFEKMKQIEQVFGRGKYKSGPEVFMRGGRIGDWKDHYGEAEKAVFKNTENKALVMLEYEQDDTW